MHVKWAHLLPFISSHTSTMAIMLPSKTNLPLLFFFFLLLLLLLPLTSSTPPESCEGLHRLPSDVARCTAVSTRLDCQPSGYINYLRLFYCTPTPLGHLLLLPYLLLLFYLLATTASRYFCPSLAGLSTNLRLSPTLAGATLLALGNGAPDVLSALVSFTSDETHSVVGLNAVLGADLFVTTVVTGAVSISAISTPIDRFSFLRDVTFLLIATSSLTLLVLYGQVHLYLALTFTSIYLLYIIIVATITPTPSPSPTPDEDLDLNGPLLPTSTTNESERMVTFQRVTRYLELPLDIPRRLTIPEPTEERWCKPYAVASATFSPVVLSILIYEKVMIGGVVVGVCLGTMAAVTTEATSAPKRLTYVWLGGGFVMSMTWAYVVAGELVSLLVSVGAIVGVSASVVGVTVLAWGNSVGDLVANVAMASGRGREGAQVSASGCYAGPVFNTLVGLGGSLTLAAWREYPSSYAVPEEVTPEIFRTLGFLVAGLVWALFVLPAKGMRLGKGFGVGLFIVYICFLCLRLATP